MKKEDIVVLSQIFTAMREGIEKLEIAEKKDNIEEIKNIKNEILSIQKRAGEILKNDK